MYEVTCFLKFFNLHLFFVDIQEFYEITLLDDTKSIQQKTAETLQIACKWENSPPLSGLNYLNNEVSQFCYLS